MPDPKHKRLSDRQRNQDVLCQRASYVCNRSHPGRDQAIRYFGSFSFRWDQNGVLVTLICIMESRGISLPLFLSEASKRNTFILTFFSSIANLLFIFCIRSTFGIERWSRVWRDDRRVWTVRGWTSYHQNRSRRRSHRRITIYLQCLWLAQGWFTKNRLLNSSLNNKIPFHLEYLF